MKEDELGELQKKLTAEEYAVCFKKGTEPPFSGRYHDCKDAGIYRCVCCGERLFDSDTKFDSGTGWPSFWQPASEDRVSCESGFQLWHDKNRGQLQEVRRPPGACL